MGHEGPGARPGRKPPYAHPGIGIPAAADELLRALAHPARRQLFAACRAGPVAAGDLVQIVGLAPASVSEHLKVLRKSALLELDVQGRHWFYQAAPEALERAIAVLTELHEAP